MFERPSPVALLLALTGCSVQPGQTPGETAITASLHAPPSSMWERISADQRAFVSTGADLWSASLPGLQAPARLGGQGLLLPGDASLRFASWGREGAMRKAVPVVPSLGACADGGEEDASGNCIRRLEYLRPGIIEWWVNRSSGLEQGWTIDEQPEGAGPLALILDIRGADLEDDPNGEQIGILDTMGREWWYTGALAWDADDRPLPAALVAEGSRILVLVDDANAAWPITVDPLVTTASATFTGEAAPNYLGSALASAGDVNGDGYGDIVIGAYGYSSNAGRAYVYHGSATGINTTAAATFTGATGQGGKVGLSVAGAGDIDRDGYDDVLIGGPGFSCVNGCGKVYVFHGSASGIDATTYTALEEPGSPSFGGSFGWSTDGAGDVNGDGFMDVIVGAYVYGSYMGRAFIYHGSASGLSTTPSTTLDGPFQSANFGYSVAGAGDINDDGFSDVVIGANTVNTNTGQAYAYHGSRNGVSTSAFVTWDGQDVGNYFGSTVDGAGDVNGDHYDDVMVGAYAYSNNTGEVTIYLGGPRGASITADTTLNGPLWSAFGWSVAGAGDVEGDGYDDIIIGATNVNSSTGEAYLYSGSATGLAPTASTTLTGATTYNEFGCAVNTAGDVDDNGSSDVLVGACTYNTSYGRAYLYQSFNDNDGDGYDSSVDCDDNDAAINPAANEIPGDGVDQDCNGREICFVDADADGYRTAATAPSTDEDCSDAGEALLTDPSPDCDDSDASIYPGAPEVVADGIDQDCDGNEGCYSDADNDGWRTTSIIVSTDNDCTDLGEAITVDPSGDCDDTSASVYPGATDSPGDGIDSNCDGTEICFVDQDNDGYRTNSTLVSADGDCRDPGEASAAAGLDCDDTASAINPGASELCATPFDDNCDGLVNDASSADAPTYFTDADLDGYGGISSARNSCTPIAGTITVGGDCDDTRASVHPGVAELCSTTYDDDCDGQVNEGDATDASMWYADADGDSFGSSTDFAWACTQQAGYVVNATDCDDSRAAVHPGADEWCNTVYDDDCDGDVNDGDAADRQDLYEDSDGDGYGNANQAIEGCEQAGYSTSYGDCDDTRANVNPAADELCATSYDDNCNGDLNDGVDGTTWYADSDADGYGNPLQSVTSCEAQPGYSENGDDCDDATSAVNPAALETCDDIDNDCDGMIDEAGAKYASDWYRDADGDGYGIDTDTVQACDEPAGYAGAAGDCDDGDFTVYPGAPDATVDGTDQDCSGTDGDGGDDPDDSTLTGDTGIKGKPECGCATRATPRTSGALILGLGLLLAVRRRYSI